jgi:hypothetical protein
MRISKTGIVMLILVLGILPSAMAQTAAQAPGSTAVPYPTAETPRAVDLGAMTVQPGGAVPMSVTVSSFGHFPRIPPILRRDNRAPGRLYPRGQYAFEL